MREPNLRTSRLAIAGGLAAAVAIGAAGFFVGRTTSPRPEPAPVAIPTPAPAASPAPEPPRVLGRADIIDLADRAADALASSTSLPAEVATAAGRRFELLLPFGCAGPASAESQATLRWRYDAEAETLRITVAPTAWQPSDWGLDEASDAAEAIEGFWINRPWSSADHCPEGRGQPAATGAEPVTLPGQTLAIAQFAAPDARRNLSRDGRPFEAVLRVPPDRVEAARGFRLRISGRVAQAPGGSPVRCIQPAGIDQRPICVVATSLDEIRVEQPNRPDPLAIWSVASAAQAD